MKKSLISSHSAYHRPRDKLVTYLANHLGKDNALASILLSLAHELTHYYQWINNIQLTPTGRERQATKYANYIIDEYASTREHP